MTHSTTCRTIAGSLMMLLSATAYATTVCDFCQLQWPSSVTVNGDTPNVFGRIYVSGLTDISSQNDGGVLAQVGWGELQTDPAAHPSWAWNSAATPNPLFSDAALDEYFGPLVITNLGEFSYTMRFSTDGGSSWVYSDLNGSDGFSTLQLGFADVVTPAPNPVPVPAAFWLFGSAVLGLFGRKRTRRGTSGTR